MFILHGPGRQLQHNRDRVSDNPDGNPTDRTAGQQPHSRTHGSGTQYPDEHYSTACRTHLSSGTGRAAAVSQRHHAVREQPVRQQQTAELLARLLRGHQRGRLRSEPAIRRHSHIRGAGYNQPPELPCWSVRLRLFSVRRLWIVRGDRLIRPDAEAQVGHQQRAVGPDRSTWYVHAHVPRAGRQSNRHYGSATGDAGHRIAPGTTDRSAGRVAREFRARMCTPQKATHPSNFIPNEILEMRLRR